MPGGDYKVEILLDETLVETATFQVTGEAAEAAAAQAEAAAQTEPAASTIQGITTCNATNDDSSCQNEIAVFAPQDTLYASVEVANGSAAMPLQAVWFYEGEMVDQVAINIEDGYSGFVAFHLSADTEFAPGSYGVEIYEAETLIAQIPLSVEEAAATESDSNAEWQTFSSDEWLLQVDYPTTWGLEDGDDALLIYSDNKTLFYLTGYSAEAAAEEENQAAIESALTKLAEQFEDFQASDVEDFVLGGVAALTSDYAYTDGDGNYIFGSIIVGTSEANNTYIVYIEALSDEYEPALNEFNTILGSLQFQ
jgi:hypothetical protein